MSETSVLSVSREAGLPKWAREELAILRNKLSDSERMLSIARNEALENGATGRVIADCLVYDGFALHDRSCVEFHLPGGKVTCMLRDNGTVLDLNSSAPMLVHPRATNSAYITVA